MNDTLLSGRFELLSELGRGGYSVVYRAFDHKLKTEVALKLFAPPPAIRENFSTRVLREAQIAHRLRHPNIVQVYDLYDGDEQTFLTMQFIDGQDLDAWVRQNGPLSDIDLKVLVEQIGGALDFAHFDGVLHRDITPKNILVDKSGRFHLTDFGFAKVTATQSQVATGFAGTVSYVAPEIFRGFPASFQSDIYSFGLSLYFAASGSLPLAAGSGIIPPNAKGFEVKARRLPASIATIIRRATRETANDRPATMRGLMALLEAPEAPEMGSSAKCLLCDAQTISEHPLCERCLIAPNSSEEQIAVFVDPTHSQPAALRSLIESDFAELPSQERSDIASGHRPLWLMPQRVASDLVQNLSERGLGVRLRPIRSRWSTVPDSMVLPSLGAVVLSLVGLIGTGSWLTALPLVFALLLIDLVRYEAPAKGHSETLLASRLGPLHVSFLEALAEMRGSRFEPLFRKTLRRLAFITRASSSMSLSVHQVRRLWSATLDVGKSLMSIESHNATFGKAGGELSEVEQQLLYRFNALSEKIGKLVADHLVTEGHSALEDSQEKETFFDLELELLKEAKAKIEATLKGELGR